MPKQDLVTTGIKFKLDVDKETRKKLDDYFDEYGKAINFAVKIIQKNLKEDRFAGKIALGEDKKPLLDKDGKKIYNYPNESCSCGNQVRRYVNAKPFCVDCYKLKFTENGIRKRMYSARGRKADSDINIKNSTNKISKTHFNYAIREGFILDKSLKKQRSKRIKKLLELKRKLQEFIDIRQGQMVLCPKIKNQRVDKFIHPSWLKRDKKLEEFRGYSLSVVEGKIKIFNRNILREEDSLRQRGHVNFKANRIMLDKSVRFLDGGKVNFNLNKGLPKEYLLDLPKKENKLSWLNEKISLIKLQKPKYAYLLRREGSFFIQYTIENVPKTFSDYLGAIGIDRGISHIAVCTFVSKNGVNKAPVFFSSGEILKLKSLQKQRDLFLRGKHNKIRKKSNMRNIDNKINLILHKYSRNIVNLAKSEKAFIVFEKLEKIKKSRFKMSKSLQYKLSQFTFKKLSDLVEYKAKIEGIKVDYVPPEYTSKECSHCGEKVDTQRPFNGNSSLFKCNKCRVQLNADYNASINIAKKSLNISNN